MGNIVDYVKCLYNDISSCVSHKGRQSNFFNIQRSVRQGCPLSALLFVIVLESFAATIRKNKNIKGLKIGETTKKISLYADDIALLLSDRGSSVRAFSILDNFEKCSGLKVNLDKTEGFSLNCNPINELNIKWNPEFFKYLGLLLCRDPQKAHKLNIDKAVKIFKTSLQAWAHRKLTFRGKITILNTNALGKVLHILALIFVPKEIFEELNRLASNFLWNSKISKISFDNVIQPLENGGLKFPSLSFE